MIETGLEGLTILMYRANHGWKVPDGGLSFARLAHQVYREDIENEILPHGCREIVAVDLQSAEWVTIYCIDESECSYPKPVKNDSQ